MDLSIRPFNPTIATSISTIITTPAIFSLENPDNFTVENSPRPVYLVVGSTPLLIASALTIFVSLIAITLNATILLAFRQNRPLINAFTIHILDLTIINLAVGVTLTVFFIPVHNFHEGCLRVRAVCAVYRSLTFLMRYMVMHQHWVICLDRWLALLVPVWYSTEKRTRYAWMSTLFFLFTGLLWTFIVVGVEFSIALPEGAYCGEPIRTSLLPVVVALTVLVPQGFIYVSNPFLLFLVWKRRNGGGSVRRQTSMAPDQGMKVLTHAKLSLNWKIQIVWESLILWSTYFRKVSQATRIISSDTFPVRSFFCRLADWPWCANGSKSIAWTHQSWTYTYEEGVQTRRTPVSYTFHYHICQTKFYLKSFT